MSYHTNKDPLYLNFRTFLFNQTYVEAIYNFSIYRNVKKDHGLPLFPSAAVPVSVIFYLAEQPQKSSPAILYCAPKTAVRRHMIEGVVIDKTDSKWLPREECKKRNGVILKVAMWGLEKDYLLITRLREMQSLKEYFHQHKDVWHSGVGLRTSKEKECQVENLFPYPFIPPKAPEKYYTVYGTLAKLGEIEPEKRNYRKISDHIFKAPYVLFKKGAHNKKFFASYVDFDSVFTSTIYSISGDGNSRILKALVAFLNSKVVHYYLFLTSSSLGIEREQLMLEDILDVPAVPFEMTDLEIDILAEKIDEIITLKKRDRAFPPNIRDIENDINDVFYNHLHLTEKEKHQIDDVLDYSFDLFMEKENSGAYLSADITDVERYTGSLCAEINQLLQQGPLNVWGSIYNVADNSPLNMVAIHFSKDKQPGFIEHVCSEGTMNQLLRTVDNYTYEKFSESIYFRKIITYYDDDTILLIKPNEKRFWSRSLAINDANEIIAEVLKA